MDICIGDPGQHAPSDPRGGGEELSNLMEKVESWLENIAHPPQPDDVLGMGIGTGPRKASNVLNERMDNLVQHAVD